MAKTEQGMAEFAALVAGYAQTDGLCRTAISNLALFRESTPHRPRPLVYDPLIIFAAQGRKRLVLDELEYEYNAGHFLTVLAPMPVQCQVIEASPDRPLLGLAITLDRRRMLELLMKMEQATPTSAKPQEIDPSGIFISPMNDRLLDAVIRLLRSLDDPCEAAVVGEAIIDEIYFRILSHERDGSLPHLLQQRGQIQQIARAVEHVHENLSEQTSVDKLAELVNMSSSGFHRKFKEVMHISPLQYAKLVKLNRAKAHLMEGKSVSQAGYLVGYNSPAQFSREYKRHFGATPSEERAS